MEFRKNALAAYVHCRKTFDQVTDKGWRRCYGWLGILVGYYTYIYAPSNNIHVDTAGANLFLFYVLTAFVTRGAEKMAGVSGGLAGIVPSILNGIRGPVSDTPIEGGPRPAQT